MSLSFVYRKGPRPARAGSCAGDRAGVGEYCGRRRAIRRTLLFGRIIDRMTGAQTAQTPLTMGDLAPLLGAWVGFGLFSIAGSVLVALNADRLSHRRRLGMMASTSITSCTCR